MTKLKKQIPENDLEKIAKYCGKNIIIYQKIGIIFLTFKDFIFGIDSGWVQRWKFWIGISGFGIRKFGIWVYGIRDWKIRDLGFRDSGLENSGIGTPSPDTTCVIFSHFNLINRYLTPRSRTDTLTLDCSENLPRTTPHQSIVRQGGILGASACSHNIHK